MRRGAGDAEMARLATAEWAQQGVKGDLGALRDVFANVRETGLAYDLDDHTPVISAVGFAFRNPPRGDPGDAIEAVARLALPP